MWASRVSDQLTRRSAAICARTRMQVINYAQIVFHGIFEFRYKCHWHEVEDMCVRHTSTMPMCKRVWCMRHAVCRTQANAHHICVIIIIKNGHWIGVLETTKCFRFFFFLVCSRFMWRVQVQQVSSIHSSRSVGWQKQILLSHKCDFIQLLCPLHASRIYWFERTKYPCIPLNIGGSRIIYYYYYR